MSSNAQNVDSSNSLKLASSPKKRKVEEHGGDSPVDPPQEPAREEAMACDGTHEERWCIRLDDTTTLLFTLDDQRLTGGRLKQMDKDGKVKFFPLRADQMDWIFQRETLPTGCYEDDAKTAQVTYPTYRTIKATKHGESSVDLELLGSGLPTFNLSYLAWFGMRHTLNDFYDSQTVIVTGFDCNCPRYTHLRLRKGYKCLVPPPPCEADDKGIFPEDHSCVLDSNTTLMYSLELKKRRSAGRLKQTASDGKVKFFPLRSEQIEWIFQRESPPSGCFKDIYYSPRVQYKCYKTIKATKREDSSVDLEL